MYREFKCLVLCSFLQFVHFIRSYNVTPSVLTSANHSTTASGNLAPANNGITTWIEVNVVPRFNMVLSDCRLLPDLLQMLVGCFNALV